MSWTRFLTSFGGVLFGLVVAVLAVLVLLDPYDTGRPGLIAKAGTEDRAPRLADASRARDPAFTAAVIGDSRVQMLEPAFLNERTGLSFVSLAIPGTGPREQLAVLDWFLAHHRAPRALVFGIDSPWCTADAALAAANPFPFWLYDRSFVRYAVGLFRYTSVERLGARLAYLAGLRPGSRRDGYWNYEPDLVAAGLSDPAVRDLRLAARGEEEPANLTGRFPAAARLAAALAGLPSTTAVVLLRPPVYVTALPLPGAEQRADDDCRQAFAAVAAARPRTVLLDWLEDRPESHVASNFIERTHYGAALARVVAQSIAAALATLG